jgi:hypothetical protein
MLTADITKLIATPSITRILPESMTSVLLSANRRGEEIIKRQRHKRNCTAAQLHSYSYSSGQPHPVLAKSMRGIQHG